MGADGLEFYVDGSKVMDLQSDISRFTTRTFDIPRPGYHVLLWTYTKDEGQSKGLDEAMISVRACIPPLPYVWMTRIVTTR
jgi:hypothetical protein